MRVTQDDLLNAVEKEPMLTHFGIGIPRIRARGRAPRSECEPEFDDARESLKNNLEQFQICCQWLSTCTIRKTANPDIGTSYSLKHLVEKHFGVYVTNGAFIAAVIHMGIPYRVIPGSPNVEVAISSKLPPSPERP